jgi:nucleoside-diphosphate-sugar epimerase
VRTIAVTGAFGFSGRRVARRLREAGYAVVTLTNAPARPDPFGGRVRAVPFNFDRPGAPAESLRGVREPIDTYWVRFDHRRFTHAQAVANTRTLFRAARAAASGGSST